MIRRALALVIAVAWAGLLAKPIAADPVTAIAPEAAVPMMINLSAARDWNTNQPFIDRMKVARTWLGHRAMQWGGMDHDDLARAGVLDAQGWPMRIPDGVASVGTLLMTDLPEEAKTLAGRYVLRFEGNGIVEVTGRAQNVRFGPNSVTFDYTPGRGGVDLRITRSDPMGTGDYVRNITVVHMDDVAAFDDGAVFNPDFLDVVRGFGGVRFMDWMNTNNSPMTRWDDRPLPDDFSYVPDGIPVEVLIALANEIDADPWLTLPHMVDDRYVRETALLVRDLLDPGLQVYVEYSNEVWNWSFRQAAWADQQAKARWGRDHQWMQFYGMRAAQIAMIWQEVFADRRDQLVSVMSVQAGWLGLERQALYAPLWQEEDPQNPAPYTLFDAYAITGYVSARLGYEDKLSLVRSWLAESRQAAITEALELGLQGVRLSAHIAAHRYDLAKTYAAGELLDGRHSGDARSSIQDLVTRIFPYHRDVAKDHDMQLIMYEGGTHVVGIGPLLDDVELDAFFRVLNYSDEMGVIYSHLLSGWASVTDGPFTVYNDISRVNKWGSWGILRYYGDTSARLDTVLQFLKGP